MGCVALCASPTLRADAKSEEKSQVKFEGMLGKMFSLFGGKMARQGLSTNIALKGDRQLSKSGETGQLIDLNEEKVYALNFKKQTYTVMTFEEIRQRMREAEQRMKEEQAKQQAKQQSSSEKAPEYDIDVATKPTGQSKSINGFDTKEVITTITIREKGKTLEQSGGMVLTSDAWLAPKIPAMQERIDFQLRYWTKLQGVGGSDELSADQLAAASAIYPMLKDAMKRVHTEGQHLDGTPIETTLTVEVVQSPEQQKETEKQQDDNAGSVGGLGGLFARKMMKKKKAEDDAGSASAPAPGHARIMTMHNEVLSVSSTVDASEVAVPEGFKKE
jgi:hypothetical protein